MAPSNKLNLAGQRFGKLTAIKDTWKRYRGLAIWQCKCDCGNTCEVTSNHLRTGHTTSCGCRLGNRNDLTNQRVGRLVVKEYVGRVNNNTMWKCICDCGNEVVVNAHSLRDCKTRSCGCLNTEVRSKTAKDRFGFVDGWEETSEIREWFQWRKFKTTFQIIFISNIHFSIGIQSILDIKYDM